MFVLECGIGIIHVGRKPVKILTKTSACAELFLPSVHLNIQPHVWNEPIMATAKLYSVTGQ